MYINEQLRLENRELKDRVKQLESELIAARVARVIANPHQQWRERLREAINTSAEEIIVKNDDVFAALCEITRAELQLP